MGRSTIEYVFDENDTQLGVGISGTGELAWVDRPVFDYNTYSYVCNQSNLNMITTGDTYSLSYL